MERKVFGRYIISDPNICHGKLTFRGTRIFVDQVLEQVMDGLSFEAIGEEWRGSISPEAIREALSLARQALFDHLDQYAIESVPV